MNPSAAAEYVSAAFIAITLICQDQYMKESKGAKWLRRTLFAALYFLLVDAFSYTFTGED